jgi:hypothetical protein
MLKKCLLALVLALCATPAFAQDAPRPFDAVLHDLAITTSTIDTLATQLKAIAAKQTALSTELQQALSEPVVPDASTLQATLDKGGVVHLVGGTIYPGSFTLGSNTTLLCHGASLTGSATAPTLSGGVGVQHVIVDGCTVTSAGYDQSAIRFGRNDSTQTARAQAPAHIWLRHISIPTYRGKHAIEVNAADFSLTGSSVLDAYDLPTSSRDSQAVWVANAPCAPCVIDGNELSAGSENIMVGGDTMKIVNPDGTLLVPTDIRLTNNHVFKPLSWQTDGVNRAVKNLIELKNGTKVLMAGNTLDGSWKAGQDGYCFVVTPRNKGDIHDVLIEHNTCTHAGGGINIMGVNDSTWTPSPVSGVVVRLNRFSIDSKTYGGRGILALLTNAPHDATFDSNIVSNTGDQIVYLDKPGSHLLVDGVTREPNLPMAVLTITNNYAIAGAYGIIIGGANRDTPLVTAGIVDQLTVTGNTVAGANSWFKKYFPSNTFVDRVTFDALLAGL